MKIIKKRKINLTPQCFESKSRILWGTAKKKFLNQYRLPVRVWILSWENFDIQVFFSSHTVARPSTLGPLVKIKI